MDEDTNTITTPLFTFLEWLFDNHGEIDRESTDEEAEKVKGMVYNLTDTITTVFESIQELEQLAITGKRPYIQTQLVDIGLKINSNTNDFENTLIEWDVLPTISQTGLVF